MSQASCALALRENRMIPRSEAAVRKNLGILILLSGLALQTLCSKVGYKALAVSTGSGVGIYVTGSRGL